jgi:hypothetical protein
MFRRKTIPHRLQGAWEAFQADAGRVEAARRALLACLPVGRVHPAPMPVGLELLRVELVTVASSMPTWRLPEVEEHWARCRSAIDDVLVQISHAQAVAVRRGELEELLDAVGEVVEPLDVWVDAERHWLSLRLGT